MKKLIAVLLCVMMVITMLASCSSIKGDNKGAVINMYLSHEIYDFDPVYAYKNDSALQLADLMFASLFYIDEKGNVKNELASNWVVDKEKNQVTITIADGAYWSDGIYVTANDFVYTIKRILDPEFTCEAAGLLYDIKNARAVKNATADLYVDDIGVDAVSEKEITITFENGFTDYEGFKRTLASPMFAPLREDLVSTNEGDWAKKPATMSCSGPFMLRKVSNDSSSKGFILERNQYYFREKDQALDKSVIPYRIVVDYTKTAEEQYEMLRNGTLFYVGNIAMSLRGQKIDNLVVKDAMSTAAIYLNQNLYFGEKIFELDLALAPTEKYVTDEQTGEKYIQITERHYSTYYNHMTPEAYAKKYNNAPFVDKSAEIPKDANGNNIWSAGYYPNRYSRFASYITESEREVDGVVYRVVHTVEDWRYVVKDENNEIISYSYDIPDGVQLFAIDEVRQALSLVIDRNAIANAVVYAQAAGAIVPNGVYNADKYKESFRSKGRDYIDLGAKIDEAKALLDSIKDQIDPAKFEFEFTVRAENEVHCYIGRVVSEAWKALGFNVKYVETTPTVNDDIGSTGEISEDIMDDTITEDLWGRTYHATLVDIVAPTVDAMSVLAPFATDFAGTAIDMLAKDSDGNYMYKVEGHITGYNSEAYNAKLEAAFAAKDKTERANLLHEAEEILMKDLPVIPIIYNKEAYVISKQLSGVKNFYFGTRDFARVKLKDYVKYLPEET